MAAEAEKKQQRSCVACGTAGRKAGLHRIVRTAAGASFDPTGRVPGRGAYVCSAECLDAACRTGKLDRALRTKLGHDDYERIAGDLAQALRGA